MADDPPALEQHHCDAGANFVRIILRPDACAGSVNAYRKIDLTTDYADNTDGSRRNAAHETHEARQ
jgi:hypothetical protein